MSPHTARLLVPALAAALLLPSAAAGRSLQGHVADLAAAERARGDEVGARFIEAWHTARTLGREEAAPPLPAEAYAANGALATWYDDLAEKVRRARHWLGDDHLYFDLDAVLANLALARYELAQGALADRRLVHDLLRVVYRRICARTFAPIPAAPPPPPPPPPTAEISVSPERILRGDPATLTWSTTNAEAARIDGEEVPLRGARTVRPGLSRSWEIVATGPGGSAAARTEIEVARAWIIFFDFDQDVVRADAADTLADLARALAEDPSLRVMAGGHTDALGTEEYNQRLSDRRTQAAIEYLRTRHGVDASRFVTRGHSEYDPIAPNTNPDGTDNPAGRAMNRRVQFTEIR